MNPKPWKYWPFLVVFGILTPIYASIRMRECGFDMGAYLERNSVIALLLLIFLRHVYALATKEKGNGWIYYLALTVATPFIVKTLVFASYPIYDFLQMGPDVIPAGRFR